MKENVSGCFFSEHSVEVDFVVGGWILWNSLFRQWISPIRQWISWHSEWLDFVDFVDFVNFAF